MSHREVIILGTASQVPTRRRGHNACFLRWDAEGMLFDPGEGTQRQLTHADLAVSQIHRVFITHFHGDHCLGLAGIIQRMSLDRVQHPVHIYYPASGQNFFDRLRRASIFHDVAEIVPVPIRQDGTLFSTDTFSVSAVRLDHGVETFGYTLREHDSRRMLRDRLDAAGVRGPAVAQLMREGRLQLGEREVRLDDVSMPRPGQRFAFVMDSRPCTGADALAERADLLVCESTYLNSERDEAHAHHHMTAEQAALLAQRGGARRLVLTHFSQRYPDVRPFLDEAAPIFPDVHAVEDFDRVVVPSRA